MSEQDDLRAWLMLAVRLAVTYHLLGYRNPGEFDANEMLRRMDNLVRELDRYDACAEKNRSQKRVARLVTVKTAERE